MNIYIIGCIVALVLSDYYIEKHIEVQGYIKTLSINRGQATILLTLLSWITVFLILVIWFLERGE